MNADAECLSALILVHLRFNFLRVCLCVLCVSAVAFLFFAVAYFVNPAQQKSRGLSSAAWFVRASNKALRHACARLRSNVGG